MKKLKRRKLSNKALITRIVVYSLFSLTSIISFSLCPKSVLNETYVYEKCVELADIDEPRYIALKDFHVYATQNKFDKALPNYINNARKEFKKNNEILVVRIPGEYQLQRFKDYILIHNIDVPELNIELCVATNIRYKNTSLPVATFISALKSIAKKVDYGYIPLLIILHLAFFIPFTVNDGLFIKELVDRRKNTNLETVNDTK